MTDYICAVGDIVQPINILSASRISNNRVCLFLSRKELVTEITDKHQSLRIKDFNIIIRPLINKLKRIIFSNVLTNIPNHIFEDILEELNIKKGSPVSTLKATIAQERYQHVASHRRQVFIKPEDAEKIPELFKIKYDDTNYYIYASTESTKCFICNLEGHLAKNCKNTVDRNLITENVLDHSNIQNSQDQESPPLVIEKEIFTGAIVETPEVNEHMDTSTIMNRKRPIPPSTTSETSSNINEGGTQPQTLSLVQEQPPTLNLENKDNKFKKPTHKKKKTKYADNEDKLNIDELLLPAKTLIENSNSTYVLKYNELQEFLEKSQGCSNIFQLSQEYSTDTAGIIKLIGDCYPHINDRYMKARLTRTKKKLQSQHLLDYDSSSTNSLQSEEDIHTDIKNK